MGLPPTSPRLKFVHTRPGGSSIPRRPPRNPAPPSTRSRSLELLDQEEQQTVAPVTIPEPLPRPRSRSLDGLLDEDGLGSVLKVEDSFSEAGSRADNNNMQEQQQKPRSRSLDGFIDNVAEDVVGRVARESSYSDDEDRRGGNIEQSVKDSELIRSEEEKSGSVERISPMPAPRIKVRTTSVEPPRIEETSDSSYDTVCGKRSALMPEITTRSVSMDDLLDDSRRVSPIEEKESSVEPTGSESSIGKERLLITGAETSTISKAKSCGAGLDLDESYSSNDYKPPNKVQGSLSSLPTGAEPKRKRNFMDKCVNKVRSFIRK